MASGTSKDALKNKKAVLEQELININSQIVGSDLAEEDVLWTTNYGSQNGYNKNQNNWNNGRYQRGGSYGISREEIGEETILTMDVLNVDQKNTGQVTVTK